MCLVHTHFKNAYLKAIDREKEKKERERERDNLPSVGALLEWLK